MEKFWTAIKRLAKCWIGKSTLECFSQEEAQALIRNDRAVLNNEYSIDTKKVVDAKGEERCFQTHKFRISKKENEKFMLGGIALDITDKLNAVKAREKREAQIQHTQKLESLGVLAGGIAHDLQQYPDGNTRLC